MLELTSTLIQHEEGYPTMGHFAKSCGISALPINEGDEVGFVFIMPNKARRERGELLSYVYTGDAFKPFAAPVYGTYDGYGGLENIVRNENTALLETIFDRPIETIMECVTSGRDIYSTVDDGIFTTYHGPAGKFDAFNSTAEENLFLMGFEKIADKSFQFENCSLVYTESIVQEHFTEYTFEIFDAAKVQLATIKTIQNFGVVLSKFAEVTGLFPGFKKEDHSRIKMLNEMSGMFILKDVFSEMHTFMENDPYSDFDSKRFEDQWTEFITMINSKELMLADLDSEVAAKVGEIIVRFSDFGQFVSTSTSLPDRFLPLFKDHKTNCFLEVIELYVVMTAVNRIFEPSFGGEQDGNLNASAHLNKISAGIIKAKKARYNYEADED